MSTLSNHWPLLLALLWIIYAVVVSCIVILERRRPVATVAWLLFLNSVPLFSLWFYYIFGPHKIRRQRSARSYGKMLIEQQKELFTDKTLVPKLNVNQASLSVLAEGIARFPLSYATDFELLESGVEAFDAIHRAVQQARHTIFLEYYTFDPDQTGTRFRDLLTRKAREGLKIMVLVDALASMRLRRKFFKEFLEAGGRLAFFHPISLRRLQPVINLRNHRKLVVCDGEVAFTGGVNITDDENRRVNPDAFHDVHMRVNGPVVHWLELMFAEDWVYTTGDSSIVALITELGAKGMQDLAKGQASGGSEELIMRPMQLVPAGPDNPNAPIMRTVAAACYHAKERIYLTTPYLIPEEASFVALTSAAQRGIDVRILLPRHSDSYVVRQASLSWYGELIRSGIKIYEYQPHMLHSKTIVIDDNLSFIGTSNFDYRSFYLNFEMALMCFTEDINRELTEEFFRCLEKSQRVTLTRLPLRKRLIISAARMLSPLL